jgi:hypothetical protein
VAASIPSFTLPEDIHKNFKRDLKIPWEDSVGNEHPLQTVVAMLDTASHGGNWVLYELLQDLNKLHLVTDTSPGAHIVRTGNGHMLAVGKIKLRWKPPHGYGYHDVECFVAPNEVASNWYDIIFGSHYTVEKKFIKVNNDSFLPLVPIDDKPTAGKHELSA